VRLLAFDELGDTRILRLPLDPAESSVNRLRMLRDCRRENPWGLAAATPGDGVELLIDCIEAIDARRSGAIGEAPVMTRGEARSSENRLFVGRRIKYM
jgi:hypothetical protein